MSEQSFVKFDRIDKSYDGDVLVVKDLNLDIQNLIVCSSSFKSLALSEVDFIAEAMIFSKLDNLEEARSPTKIEAASSRPLS